MSSIIDACISHEEESRQTERLIDALDSMPLVSEALDLWRGEKEVNTDTCNDFLKIYGFKINFNLTLNIAEIYVHILGKRLQVDTIPLSRGLEYAEILIKGFEFIEEFHGNPIFKLVVAGNHVYFDEDTKIECS